MRRIPPIMRESIFRQWLAGDSYIKIARDKNVSISTVHVIKEEFKKKMPDIEDLRRLSVLMKKLNINPYDSLRGSIFLEKLNNWHVSLDDFDKFMKLIETLSSENNSRKEEIIEASLRLIALEEKTGKSYPEVVKDFQKKNSKIPKLEARITHLEEKESAKRNQNSKLERTAEALQIENQRLRSQKNGLLNEITALRDVCSVLRKLTLQIPCQHCGWPYMELKIPTRQEYLSLTRSGGDCRALCQNCRQVNIFDPQEIAATLAWVLLPESIPLSSS